MNTNEQNKRPDQEKATKVAPNTGGDQKKPVEEPTRKAGEERKDSPKV